MPFCPTCEQEYEAFARECPDCGVELVARLEPKDPGGGGMSIAALRAADPDLASAALEVLRGAGLPSRPFDEGDEAGVLVPADFLRSALAVLSRAPGLAVDEDEAGELLITREEPSEDEGDPPDVSILARPRAELAAAGEEVIADLLEIVRRADADPRRRAILAIQAMGPVGQSTLVRHIALLAREQRDEALFAVTREVRDHPVRDEDAEHLFEVAMDHNAPVESRTLALHAIGRLPLSHLAARLLALLDDATPEVREYADEALCSLFDEDVGFDPAAPPEERARAIEAWRRLVG